MFLKIKEHKGFTLVEILVVIVIIAILFTVILPRIDFASNKARETGVKTDFRTFIQASETYLRETAGKNMTLEGLNKYLDENLKFTNISGDLWNGNNLSKKLDPWKRSYSLKMDNILGKIVVVSRGKTGGYDFVLTSYHYEGTVDSCTDKFSSGNIEAKSFIIDGDCGGNILDLAT